jgi:hypothetical protein
MRRLRAQCLAAPFTYLMCISPRHHFFGHAFFPRTCRVPGGLFHYQRQSASGQPLLCICGVLPFCCSRHGSRQSPWVGYRFGTQSAHQRHPQCTWMCCSYSARPSGGAMADIRGANSQEVWWVPAPERSKLLHRPLAGARGPLASDLVVLL